jgi:signal transduction histidine kinase
MIDRAMRSNEWLERANHLSLVADLLSGTLHDVNNLLQVVSGNAELLESAGTSEDVLARRARTIGTSARKASALLADVLVFARDGGADGQAVDLQQLARRGLSLRRFAVEKARIDAAVDETASPVVGRGNPRAVLQIVLNLIVNAEQALAGRSGSRCRIRTALQGDRATMTVEDNGAGLPKELETALFQPVVDEGSAQLGVKQLGVKLGATRLGIGLAVSHLLAQAQGGTLSHQAPPGGGCAMTLSLPRQA